VFECCNPVGNKLLRDMEPPRHDNWDADLPEKGDSTKVKKELDSHIIEYIKALTPVSTETMLAISELDRYLPDDGDTPEDSFDGPSAEGIGKHESFDRTPKIQAIPGKAMDRKPATQPGGQSPGDGDLEAGGEDSGGDEGGPANDGGGGDRGSGGGGGEESGRPGGESGRTPVEVRSRAFLCDLEQGHYTITVQPPRSLPSGVVFLSVAAVGDDSQPTPVRIRTARVAGGRKLELPKPGRIGPVTFPKNGPLRVEVTLVEPRRLALDVTAYEEAADEAE